MTQMRIWPLTLIQMFYLLFIHHLIPQRLESTFLIKNNPKWKSGTSTFKYNNKQLSVSYLTTLTPSSFSNNHLSPSFHLPIPFSWNLDESTPKYVHTFITFTCNIKGTGSECALQTLNDLLRWILMSTGRISCKQYRPHNCS